MKKNAYRIGNSVRGFTPHWHIFVGFLVLAQGEQKEKQAFVCLKIRLSASGEEKKMN